MQVKPDRETVEGNGDDDERSLKVGNGFSRTFERFAKKILLLTLFDSYADYSHFTKQKFSVTVRVARLSSF